MINDKKVMYSGMQPSGKITIGNYFGALKNWVTLNEKYNCLFSVVDLHAITVKQEPAKLRQASKELLALYIASGLDPEENILYLQSSVKEHAELAWILSCYTHMGELNRMTQFKEKSSRVGQNINAGLYTYPILMASDILLYQTDLVPVGTDQKQHLELTRDLAIRFNNAYSPTFTVPEPYIAEIGGKVTSLQEPEKKMSKSDENENSYITLLDPKDAIVRKINRAVTDSLTTIEFDREKRPGVSNLLEIYHMSTDMPMDKIIQHFEGKGYGVLKKEVAEALIAVLEPIQVRFDEIIKDKSYLEDIIKSNGDRARSIASRTMSKVKRKIGFIS